MPKIKIPDWSECEDAFASGVKLNPLQQFVLDNEPAGPLEEVFLKQLSDLIEFVEASAAPVPEVDWCKRCGCGNDAAGYAHTALCPAPSELVKALESAERGLAAFCDGDDWIGTMPGDALQEVRAELDKVKS